MIEAIIMTYEPKEPTLANYCAQVWQGSKNLASGTFHDPQTAYDWCVAHGATIIDCHIYAS